jgi:hypothetical protein
MEEKYNIESGEEKAWRELSEADPQAVARRSLAAWFANSGTYDIEVLGEHYEVDPKARKVRNLTNPSRKYECFLNLSIPIYMLTAREIPVSGELVKELKGGDFFFRGSHTLPLDALSEKYGRDKALLRSGQGHGRGNSETWGRRLQVQLFPACLDGLRLWLEDDEFPARLASCSTLPPTGIWRSTSCGRWRSFPASGCWLAR